MSDINSEKEIARLRGEVEAALNWGSVSHWHSKMFDELSEKVFDATKVMLSVATLKRFFGVVKHKGVPSISTLDALSQFVGKENWRDFKTTSPIKNRQQRVSGKSTYVTIGFILALITLSLIGNRRPDVIINASEFSFSSKVLSKEYPNSVVFDFTIPSDLRTDSLHIQQYWDPSRTISIQKDQTQATGIYYFPGYFKAKLMVDGQQAKAHDLFLKSQGWLGMIEYNHTPKYFQPVTSGTNLSFPIDIVDEVTSQSEPVVSSFHFIDDLGEVSGDNFSFTTTIKNTFDDRWAVCQKVDVYFIGTDGAMIIPFSKIGCSSDNNLMINDVYLRGRENDLSALSADFEKPVQLEINNENMTLSITIVGKKVFNQTYQESMGRLVGLRFKFKGLGEVLHFELLNQNMKSVSFQETI